MCESVERSHHEYFISNWVLSKLFLLTFYLNICKWQNDRHLLLALIRIEMGKREKNTRNKFHLVQFLSGGYLERIWLQVVERFYCSPAGLFKEKHSCKQQVRENKSWSRHWSKFEHFWEFRDNIYLCLRRTRKFVTGFVAIAEDFLRIFHKVLSYFNEFLRYENLLWFYK